MSRDFSTIRRDFFVSFISYSVFIEEHVETKEILPGAYYYGRDEVLLFIIRLCFIRTIKTLKLERRRQKLSFNNYDPHDNNIFAVVGGRNVNTLFNKNFNAYFVRFYHLFNLISFYCIKFFYFS